MYFSFCPLLNFIQMDSRSMYPFYPDSLTLPIGAVYLYSFIPPTLWLCPHLSALPPVLGCWVSFRVLLLQAKWSWALFCLGQLERIGTWKCWTDRAADLRSREIMPNCSRKSLCLFYIPTSSSLGFYPCQYLLLPDLHFFFNLGRMVCHCGFILSFADF